MLVIPFAAQALEIEVKNVQPKSWFRKTATSFEVKEYVAKTPPAAVIDEPDSVVSCSLDGKRCDAKKPIAFVFARPIPATRSLILKTKDGKKHEFKFDFFQASDKGFKIEGKSVIDRDYVFDSESYLLVLKSDGSLRYYRETESKVHDFRPHEIDGKRYYSYLAVEKSADLVNGLGHRVLLDENFNQIEIFKELMDGHEFILLGRNHYLYTDYYTSDSKDGSCILENDVKESRDGKVTTVFSMSEFAKRMALPPGPNGSFEGRDCRAMGHLNSIQPIDDKRLLLGIGDRVVMFDRRAGKADWIFGSKPPSDFVVPKGFEFGLVHTPTWFEKSSLLALYSNSTSKTDRTKVLLFDLDVANKKVSSPRAIVFDSYDSEYGGGGFDIEGEVITVAFGIHKGPWDIQGTKNGKLALSLRLGPNGKYFVYRVYRSVR